MPECLIIDDEPSIAMTICEYFNLLDVSCEYATDYDSGLRIAKEMQPSLILLDVNLGGQSGFALCKALRESSDVPILFISARNTDDDVLTALSLGGDDYMTKPFSMAVLLAKAKAMLKRSGGAAVTTQQGGAAVAAGGEAVAARLEGAAAKAGSAAHGSSTLPGSAAAQSASTEQSNSVAQKSSPKEIIRFGCVEIDRDSDRVSRGSDPVKLKPQELKLLLYLYDNRGRRITKDELLENVWGDTFIGEGTLSVHIRHLREKLEDDPKYPRFLKTMWGSGYMFEESD